MGLRRQLALATALLILALAAVAAPASASPGSSVRAQPAPLRVMIAVLPFKVHSSKPLEYLESSLADLLASRLEASGRIEVVEAVTVRETLVAFSGERTEDAVRRMATELGADYVVVGSLTELAGRYSLDVRVTPVDSLVATSTMVFTADDDDELLDRVNELASRILEITGSPTTRSRVAEVRFEGMELPAEIRPEDLRMRRGVAYDSAGVRRDLERIRALDAVGTATAETERGEQGVSVVYKLVPRERIVPGSPVDRASDRIAEILIEGNRRLEEGAIRARITSKVGDPFNQAQVASDVREVHASGYFRNVQVFSEDGDEGRIVTFRVEENPVVRQITISGNDNLDGEKIRDSLTLSTGSTLDFPLLFENRERVEALYRAEGFYLAQVRYEIEELPTDAVAIHFEVEEQEKLRLQTIRFEGNDAFTDEELKRGLKTKIWRFYSYVTRFLDRSGTYSEPVFLQDLQTINNKYLDKGYIQVDISDPEVIPTEEGLEVEVTITEGPQYNVGKVDVSGDETVDLDQLRKDLELKSGEVFSRSSLNSDREALERRYTDRGFYLAEVSPQTGVDDAELLVDITFRVSKGPLYFVREIDIAGNTATTDTVIRREIQSVEGQLYSARSVRVSESRVKRLGFFEEATFEPQQTDYPDQLDLDVRVVERPTGSLSFGAGFSSQDGFLVTGSVSQSNLFGRGYGGSLAADIGGDSNRFFLNFVDPYFLGTTWRFSSSVFVTNIEFEDFEQERQGIDLNFDHALDLENRTRGSIRYSFSRQEVDRPGDVNAASVIFREILTGETTTSLVGVGWRQDTRNDRIAATDGHVYSVGADLAGPLGFANFARLEARGSWFFEMPEWMPSWWPFRDNSTFVLGARMGWAVPFNDVDDYDLLVTAVQPDPASEVQGLGQIDDDLTLPLSERYFLGGIGTYQLRGFKARSVGPRRALLRRTGAAGTGAFFTPVGRDVQVIPTEDGQVVDAICIDQPFEGFEEVFGFEFNPLQGNQNGKCNSLRDKDLDDFDDLDETDVVGGNKFFSVSLEYRFPLSESLGLIGILFLDFGNAFDETQNIWDFAEWRWGTGFGALWFSPFGPLQAFVGFPIDRISEVEDLPVFEFSVGGAGF
ncbi:MAG: outer membrane protein assembly factor BamA [Myxococcota bacterium]|nr:outer membrane protein assembly factor BamA [Myxococcota bacterium]